MPFDRLGALREELYLNEAVDVFWFYFGYSGLFTLHDENGWSYERAEHWLCRKASLALLRNVVDFQNSGLQDGLSTFAIVNERNAGQACELLVRCGGGVSGFASLIARTLLDPFEIRVRVVANSYAVGGGPFKARSQHYVGAAEATATSSTIETSEGWIRQRSLSPRLCPTSASLAFPRPLITTAACTA
jgi:hypothetical protein